MSKNLLVALAALSAAMAENDAELKERLHPVTVQKLADARQAVEIEMASPEAVYLAADDTLHDLGGGQPYEPTLPPILKDLLDRALAELDRKAEFDNAMAAIASRYAAALEAIAERLAVLTAPPAVQG